MKEREHSSGEECGEVERWRAGEKESRSAGVKAGMRGCGWCVASQVAELCFCFVCVCNFHSSPLPLNTADRHNSRSTRPLHFESSLSTMNALEANAAGSILLGLGLEVEAAKLDHCLYDAPQRRDHA